jgi:preprotein translocase subunit SecF
MEILKNPNYDFLGKAKFFVTLSVLLIAAGAVHMYQQGIRYGVEFEGGTQLIVQFQSRPDVGAVRAVVEKVAPGVAIQGYDAPARNQVLVRVAGGDLAAKSQAILQALGEAYPQNRASIASSDETQMTLRFDSQPALDSVRPAVAQMAPDTVVEIYGDATKNELVIRRDPSQQVMNVLRQSYSQNPAQIVGSETVGPVVGAELRKKAIQLTVLGLLFQFIYIGIRFKGAIWGSAATIAVFHDVLVTLAFLAFFRYEITLNVIAALLTLVGYSVNDTIVIFDRARENLRQRRKDPFRQIINDSVNQTLTRTVISNGTTFLAVLGLFVFGGEALKAFGFTMVVGILVGTYSTVFIASPIVVMWEAFRLRRSTPRAG